MVGNLLDNAIKFTEAGSVQIHATPVSEGVEIVVTDTGCGMTQQGLHDTFKPLTQ